MKIIISPAKSLDFESKVPTSLHTQPRFLDQSEKLNKKLKTLSKKNLSELMKISDDLSALNYDRNQTWETPFTPENAKQAIYSFTGAVFQGIDVNSIAEEKITITTKQLKNIVWFIWCLKTFRFNTTLSFRNGNKIKSWYQTKICINFGMILLPIL